MKKKVVVYYQNGYGLKWSKEFDTAEDYLEWKCENPELWNCRQEPYLELIKVTTKWLPLNWSVLT